MTTRVYLARITNSRGLTLYKYGHTSQPEIAFRFAEEIGCGFDVEVLEETCYNSTTDACAAERDKLAHVDRYIVFAKFLIGAGDTELFLTNPLTGEKSNNPPPGKVAADTYRRPARKSRRIHQDPPERYTPYGVVSNERW